MPFPIAAAALMAARTAATTAAAAAPGMFKSGAKKAFSAGKQYAVSAGKFAAEEARGLARNIVTNTTARAAAKATNFLDAQKRRIYETATGSYYTNTRNGNRNYRPRAVYENVVGTRNVNKLNKPGYLTKTYNNVNRFY